MDPIILKKLKKWRDETARKEGVENFRVIPNSAIEEIARVLPENREELTSIKGIKDKKFFKYGRDIFDIVKGDSGKSDIISRPLLSWKDLKKPPTSPYSANLENKLFSVSEYLDFLNEKLLMSGRVRVRGEVTSVDMRERVVYFSLKDSRDESVLNCLIFKYNYDVSAINLEAGMEVIITSIPEIYKPTGRLSMKTSLIEIAGEGLLKKAYDELRAKLEKEGLFGVETKKTMPKLPRVIGLITSNQGAAIGDFTTNIGNYGFRIKFINSSVEGKSAIFDLLNAMRTAQKLHDLDVLAIVRGGGSLESLQAFNNEKLVREIKKFNIPVVCGIGHEKDVSLVSLAADFCVSTPTAAAVAIRASWDDASGKIDHTKNMLLNMFEGELDDGQRRLENINFKLLGFFNEMIRSFDEIIYGIKSHLNNLSAAIQINNDELLSLGHKIFSKYENFLYYTNERIKTCKIYIQSRDPEKQLKFGYSIAYSGNKIVSSIFDVKGGDDLKIKVFDGSIGANVIKTDNN